jgi:hypothetical protein
VAARRRHSTEAGRRPCWGRTSPPTACTGAAPPGPGAKVRKAISNTASCSEAVLALLVAAQHRVDEGLLAECRCVPPRVSLESAQCASVAEHRSGAGVTVGCTLARATQCMFPLFPSLTADTCTVPSRSRHLGGCGDAAAKGRVGCGSRSGLCSSIRPRGTPRRSPCRPAPLAF